MMWLSEAPEHTLRLSSLAARFQQSLSAIRRTVGRLETQGLVPRHDRPPLIALPRLDRPASTLGGAAGQLTGLIMWPCVGRFRAGRESLGLIEGREHGDGDGAGQ